MATSFAEFIAFYRGRVMIRVLQVFASTSRGGSETMMMNHYRHLNTSEFQFDFISHFPKETDYDREINSLGGRVFHLPQFKGYNYVEYVSAWENLLNEHHEWQIVHIHYFTLSWLIAPIVQSYKRHCIIHSHASVIDSRLKRLAFRLMRRRAVDNSDLLLACSLSAGTNIFGNVPFRLFKNAIEVDRFAFDVNSRNRLREEHKINSDEFVIGNVGSFRSRVKNQLFLIDVFKSICDRGIRTKLILVGDGRYIADAKRTVDKLGLSNFVVFTGACANVYEYLSLFDVFVMPSLSEGFPVSVVEALSSGLPCLLSDTIPHEVAISDLVSFISLNESVEVWAENVMRRIQMRDRSASANMVKLAGYDVTDNVKELEELYRQVHK